MTLTEPVIIGALSPSRAGDFMTCPLLYRFRVVDQLPEKPSPAAVRGTVVHAVLERLYDLPAPERSVRAALELLEPQWSRLLAEDPQLGEMFADDDEQAAWLGQAREMLERYFTLEDPTRLPGGEREILVETVVDDQLRLRGFVDRLDTSPTGQLRVVDYKTGGAPREAFEARALFQLKFYALVLWRARGVVPRVLRLLYLRDGEICDYTPDAEELRRFERTLLALWRAIEAATTAGDFRPKPSRLCGWCGFRSYCPAFGGTPPPMPVTGPLLPRKEPTPPW